MQAASAVDVGQIHQMRKMRRLRWTAFGLVAMAYMLSFFQRTAPAAIANDLGLAFHAGGAALGMLAATYFYVYTLMQIPTGILADTWGPRRLVAVGCLIAGIGSAIFGLAESFSAAAMGRTLVGLGASVTLVSLMKLNTAWFFERQFATLTGLAMLLGNLGAFISGAPLAWLVAAISWRSVFIGVGVFTALLGVFVWLMVRDHPGQAGLPTMRALEGKPPHEPHMGHWLEGLLEIMKNRETWPGFWVNLGGAGAFLSFAGLWAVPYFTQVHGMTRALAANHVSLLLICFGLGAFATGSLSDRIGRRRILLIILGAIQVPCWLPWMAGVHLSPAASYGLCAVMGLSASGMALTWACAKEVNRPTLSGMATSVVNTGVFLGAGLLQPLVGWVLDRSWDGTLVNGAKLYSAADFRLAFGMLLAFTLFSLVATFFVRETYCHNVTLRH